MNFNHPDGMPCDHKWPWQHTDDGSMTIATLASYFESKIDAEAVAREWIDILADVANQHGVTQPVKREGDVIHFHPDFQALIVSLPSELHQRAVLMARINAGHSKVGMMGEQGISIISRAELEEDPDIDALRRTLGDESTGS